MNFSKKNKNQSELEKIFGQTYENKTVKLDGNNFINCKFLSCTFEFESGNFHMDNCDISNCRATPLNKESGKILYLGAFLAETFLKEGKKLALVDEYGRETEFSKD